MALAAQIKVDTAEVDRLLKGLGRASDRIITRALNRTANSVKTAGVRAIAKDLRVPQKSVRAAVRVEKATFNKRQAAVEATGERLPLMAFGARQTKRGVTYKAQQGRSLVRGAFIQTMPSGHEGVFARTGRKKRMTKGNYKGQLRETIRELYGVSIPYVMVQKHIVNAMDDRGAEVWPVEIKRQLQSYVKRGR